jgi:hypothetical protein
MNIVLTSILWCGLRTSVALRSPIMATFTAETLHHASGTTLFYSQPYCVHEHVASAHVCMARCIACSKASLLCDVPVTSCKRDIFRAQLSTDAAIVRFSGTFTRVITPSRPCLVSVSLFTRREINLVEWSNVCNVWSAVAGFAPFKFWSADRGHPHLGGMCTCGVG